MTTDPPPERGTVHQRLTRERRGAILDLLHGSDTAEDREPAAGIELTGLGLLDHLVETVARTAEPPATTLWSTVLSGGPVPLDDLERQQWLSDRYAELRSMVATALSDARDIGEIRDDADIEETATAFVAVMDGLQVQRSLAPTAVDVPAVLRRTLAALLAALMPDED